MRVARSVPTPVRAAVRQVLPAPLWKVVRDVAHGDTRPQRTTRDVRARAAKARHAKNQPDVSTVFLRERALLAHHVSTFRASEVLRSNFAMVADALEDHGVPYVVLDSEPQQRRVIVISSQRRADAVAALERSLEDACVYAGRVRGPKVVGQHVIGRRTLPRRAPAIRIFRVYSSPGGQYLGGQHLGCEVQFWRHVEPGSGLRLHGEPVPDGSLLAPRPNRWADVVRPDEAEIKTRDVDGARRPGLSLVRQPHALLFRRPVDVVYTWVDGRDPAWLARMSAALDAHGRGTSTLHALAANQSRFESRDELRYSLRSLDMYADWVRHVYLVTDDQVPEWLDLEHPGLTVVSHRELFGDRGRLPTFNSHAIESQLHRIPGLSEHYLYLNDDVFFGRPVNPSLFFAGNGMPIFTLSDAKIGLGPATEDDPPVMSAGKNNRDLLAETFGVTVTNKFKHVPHALRRSVIAEIEESFPEDFARTAQAQFRSWRDLSVSSSLAHYYGYLTGRAVPGELSYFYTDIADENTPSRLKRLLASRNVDVFCLNDHDSRSMPAEHQAKIVGDFLDAYYPLPSAYEKDPGRG